MMVSIHQPEFLPWMSFFDKVDRSDVFVIMDDAQFRKNYYQNRCKIRSAHSIVILTVPVFSDRLSKRINETKIAGDRWKGKFGKSIIQNYSKACYFEVYGKPFFEVLFARWVTIADLNVELIHMMIEAFGIKTPVYLSSRLDLDPNAKSSEKILGICRYFGTQDYLSGRFGKSYLDLSSFKANGINVYWQDYQCPKYPQVYDPFIPELSALDLLLNMGPGSLNIIRAGRRLSNAEGGEET